MTGIVDYGMGNLRSVQKAVEFVGGKCLISSIPSELNACERLILPGVGSFGVGMDNLRRTGLEAYVRMRVQDTPLLGICLGMQFLLAESDEEGVHAGLSLVSGRAEKFTQGKIPHMGWNGVSSLRTALFEGIAEGTPFYFVHSYRATTQGDEAIALCDYHVTFAAAVHRGNAYGVQFHPEKSGDAGLRLLENFLKRI